MHVSCVAYCHPSNRDARNDEAGPHNKAERPALLHRSTRVHPVLRPRFPERPKLSIPIRLQLSCAPRAGKQALSYPSGHLRPTERQHASEAFDGCDGRTTRAQRNDFVVIVTRLIKGRPDTTYSGEQILVINGPNNMEN